VVWSSLAAAAHKKPGFVEDNRKRFLTRAARHVRREFFVGASIIPFHKPPIRSPNRDTERGECDAVARPHFNQTICVAYIACDGTN
jgi:hypothetical protein